MKSTAGEVDSAVQDVILAIEISDEALEASAGIENGGSPNNFTVAACTGLSACFP
jgi:hypothetical protein